jgi:hypothetical protein
MCCLSATRRPACDRLLVARAASCFGVGGDNEGERDTLVLSYPIREANKVHFFQEEPDHTLYQFGTKSNHF